MATFTAIKNKTQSRGALGRALDYVRQEKKTLWEERQLVSGHNCVAQSAYHEMMTTKRQFQKTDGRMFFQFVQSFDPAENVTPQEVHAIGLELAQRLFPGFEVVVATHVDADHLHNHLIVNSVSWKDGHKLHQNAADQGSNGDPSVTGAAGTGWEEERLAAFSAPAPSAPTQSGMAVGHPDPGGVICAVAALGYALERSQRPAPAAPIRAHGDRKALSQERKKKIAMGHKADDREEQSHTNTMRLM